MSKSKSKSTTKVKSDKKACWVATEVKGGWRLKLAYGPKNYNLKGLVCKTEAEVERIVHNLNTVYVHLKRTKFPTK